MESAVMEGRLLRIRWWGWRWWMDHTRGWQLWLGWWTVTDEVDRETDRWLPRRSKACCT